MFHEANNRSCTFFSGKKLHPVYAFSFNYGMWWRSKRSGWSLLGFIPVIRPLVAFAASVHIRKYRRLVARFCMAQLFKSTIAATDGMFIDHIDAAGATETLLVHPRVPFNIADEPEMQASFVGSKIGAMSAMPCSVCEVVPKEDGLMTEGKLRDASVMRAIFPVDGAGKSVSQSTAKLLTEQFSIHSEWNPCWWIPGYDPFSNPGCIIHQLDHGVFDVVLDLVIQLLKSNFPAGSVGQFDIRWAQLAKFPGGKKFKRGVSTLANATCSEHRIMSMGLPFAVRGFSPSLTSAVIVVDRDASSVTELPEFFLENLSLVYLRWRWMLAKKRFTTEMRYAIATDGRQLWALINQLHRFVHDDVPIELGTKLHKICHWVQWIAMFGAPENWSSEIWEGAHKVVKRWGPCMSWKSQGSASRKVMQAHSVYDAHASEFGGGISNHVSGNAVESVNMNAPPGWAVKVPIGGSICRFGMGGFRGRSNVGRMFNISNETQLYLREWEITSERRRLSLDERIMFYVASVPICFQPDLGILIRILSKAFHRSDGTLASQVDSDVIDYDEDEIPLFQLFVGGNSHRTDPFDFLRIWNKSFIDSLAEGAYAEVGTFVEYYRQSGRSVIGMIKWIVSVFGRQIIIMQRMREVPVKGGPMKGEGFIDQFVRQNGEPAGRSNSSGKLQCDPLKRCFWMLQFLEDDAVSSYDVILLPVAESQDVAYPIVSIVMLQPDFTSGSFFRQGKEIPSRWFLLEYVLL